MECLTAIECSEWLQQNGIDESPYGHGLSKGVFYIQFEPPSEVELRLFIQSLFESFGHFDGCLLQIHDWIYDSEFEKDPTSGIRQTYGETRSLIEVPGYLFGSGELSDAINLSALVVERDWTAYLYPTSKAATLLLWEGALVDFWSNYKNVEENVHSELFRSNLRIVHRYKG